jgi:D-alanyl-D-alanine carboxypeptidase
MKKPLILILIILTLAGMGASTYFAIKSHSQQAQIDMLLYERNFFLTESASSTKALQTASTTIAELTATLNDLGVELEDLSDNYRSERERNEEFEDQIKDIAGTVGDLDKLSKTDKELLQKYSKVYFLNEHYIPESLSKLENAYVYDESKEHFVHSKVEPFLVKMINEAKEDGVDLWVVSAYRSYETQAQLKGQYLVSYGAGANTFSADQGYSEHQLGTTIDFTTAGINGGLSGFEATPAYSWLTENAHRFGFTLSYPENNVHYVFEPWHWRFVGTDLARDLKRDGATFYDWDQRKIDEYLIKIFD